jgi:hypothetical protein
LGTSGYWDKFFCGASNVRLAKITEDADPLYLLDFKNLTDLNSLTFDTRQFFFQIGFNLKNLFFALSFGDFKIAFQSKFGISLKKQIKDRNILTRT